MKSETDIKKEKVRKPMTDLEKPAIQPLRLKKLLQKMVDIYSPSGKEQDITDFLKVYMRRNGLLVKEQPVDDDRCNLVVMPRKTESPLVFVGHIDTVSAYDFENFGYMEDRDVVSGLGTADMKGGCAAMIEAFIALKEKTGTENPFAMAMVVGEEENGDGAEQFLKTYHFPWAIIGEPTDLVPCLSCFGYIEIQLISQGRRMHASLAARHENAVEVILQKLLKLSRYMDENRHEVTYNIRDVFSSQTGFTVAERCEAWVDIHLPADVAAVDVVTEIEELMASDNPVNIRTDFKTVTIDAGYALPEKGPIPGAIRRVFDRMGMDWAPRSFPSHSDANQFWSSGIKPVILGPGKLENAHTQDEWVAFSGVCRAADIYLDIMLDLMADDRD